MEVKKRLDFENVFIIFNVVRWKWLGNSIRHFIQLNPKKITIKTFGFRTELVDIMQILIVLNFFNQISLK